MGEVPQPDVATLPPSLPSAAEFVPLELQAYAENLFRRFPEVFFSLGAPGIEEAFEARAAGRWHQRVIESPSEKVIQIVLPRNGYLSTDSDEPEDCKEDVSAAGVELTYWASEEEGDGFIAHAKDPKILGGLGEFTHLGQQGGQHSRQLQPDPPGVRGHPPQHPRVGKSACEQYQSPDIKDAHDFADQEDDGLVPVTPCSSVTSSLAERRGINVMQVNTQRPASNQGGIQRMPHLDRYSGRTHSSGGSHSAVSGKSPKSDEQEDALHEQQLHACSNLHAGCRSCSLGPVDRTSMGDGPKLDGVHGRSPCDSRGQLAHARQGHAAGHSGPRLPGGMEEDPRPRAADLGAASRYMQQMRESGLAMHALPPWLTPSTVEGTAGSSQNIPRVQRPAGAGSGLDAQLRGDSGPGAQIQRTAGLHSGRDYAREARGDESPGAQIQRAAKPQATLRQQQGDDSLGAGIQRAAAPQANRSFPAHLQANESPGAQIQRSSKQGSSSDFGFPPPAQGGEESPGAQIHRAARPQVTHDGSRLQMQGGDASFRAQTHKLARPQGSCSDATLRMPGGSESHVAQIQAAAMPHPKGNCSLQCQARSKESAGAQIQRAGRPQAGSDGAALQWQIPEEESPGAQIQRIARQQARGCSTAVQREMPGDESPGRQIQAAARLHATGGLTPGSQWPPPGDEILRMQVQWASNAAPQWQAPGEESPVSKIQRAAGLQSSDGLAPGLQWQLLGGESPGAQIRQAARPQARGACTWHWQMPNDDSPGAQIQRTARRQSSEAFTRQLQMLDNESPMAQIQGADRPQAGAAWWETPNDDKSPGAQIQRAARPQAKAPQWRTPGTESPGAQMQRAARTQAQGGSALHVGDAGPAARGNGSHEGGQAQGGEEASMALIQRAAGQQSRSPEVHGTLHQTGPPSLTGCFGGQLPLASNCRSPGARIENLAAAHGSNRR